MDGFDSFAARLSRRSSGIEYNDVFGGPPTRSVRNGVSTDSLSSSGWEADGVGLLRLSFGEKPVFGEVCSPSFRRKGVRDDFFNDIFNGDGGGSACSTPRRLDWDAMASAPGSRVLSPVVAVPRRPEMAESAFLLSPLSDNQNKEQAQGYPASAPSPDQSLNKIEDADSFPTAADHKTGSCYYSLHGSNQSIRIIHGEDASLKTDDTACIGAKDDLDRDLANRKDLKKNSHFHFSIYKWASRGVMLMFPTSPNMGKTRSGLSGIPVPFLQGVDLPLNRKTLHTHDQVFPSEFESPDAKTSSANDSETEFTDAACKTSHGDSDAMPSPEKVNVRTDKMGEHRRQVVSKTTTHQNDGENGKSEDKLLSDKANGKVKDFIKIFNQDTYSSPLNFVGSQSQSTKSKDMEKNIKIKEHVKEEFQHKHSSENNEATISCTEATTENVEMLYGDTDDPYFEVEECTVEEVLFPLQDQDLPLTAAKVEEFHNPDVMIREWSSGKEGNIRSLLSTVQYVLWPGSGWKVVPLVDLIETSSVRRAYQRALLCLHPDKLQQRGAPDQQKYIAEKVFGILQEAWDQFSSVSSI